MFSKENFEVNLEYTLTDTDIRQCIEFAVRYYFKNKGSHTSRTTGQARGLGAIINDWVGGKAIELGIKGILESITPNKKIGLDFSIHEKSKKEDDPDIIKIKEDGVERDPKLFVEIKSLSENDRWIGLTEDQFKAMKSRVSGDLNNIILIYAGLDNNEEDNGKRTDLLGAFLKGATKQEFSKLFEDFVDVGKIKIKAMFVITGKDLDEHGVKFTTEDFLYETEIFEESHQKLDKLKEFAMRGNILPKFRPDKNYPYPPKIGDITFEGNLKAFLKINRKSERMLLKCESDVFVKNSVLGNFKLLKGKTYYYSPGGAGRNKSIFRDNRWIAARNALNISGKSVDATMKEIAYKI